MKAKARTNTHASRTSASIGGVQAECAHKNTHPYAPARNGGAQLKPESKQAQTHRRPQAALAGYRPKRAHKHTYPNSAARIGEVKA